MLSLSADDEAEGLSAEGLLLLAAENLKKSIDFSARQLNTRKVRGEMKLRWSRALTRQVEALVKIAEALSRIEGRSSADLDLATFLSTLESKVPKRYVSRRLGKGGESGYCSRRD